jgi:hypothetical protein
MYPAQAFYDGLYTEDDLPDTLIINPYDLNSGQSAISVEVSRNGLIYGPYEFFEGYAQQVTIIEDFFGEGPQWILEQVGSAELDGSPCLFFDFGPEVGGLGPAGITDTFADTYEIDVQNAGQINELSRNSLCVWGGAQSNYLAYYDGNDSFISAYYSGPPHKWIFIRGTLQPDEGGGVWEKDSPQNGPEGTYSPSANAGDFAGVGTVTVSEP